MTGAPLVGIVVVSHSRALARAAIALAEEMLHGKQLRIAVAAGLDDRTFGTDAVQIVDAVLAADDGAGVVIIMDLGSAILSAELALDLLDEDVRSRVQLCGAPLVEGLIVAAVAAAGGASREEVAAEANAALAGKMSHLAESTPSSGGCSTEMAPGLESDSIVGRFVVANAHGLHARPASRLVQEVRAMDAKVTLLNLTTGSGPVPASSLSRVATLGALAGHEVQVSATGTQAREAVDHVLSLALRRFDEQIQTPRNGVSMPSATPTVLPDDDLPSALPAAPGIGIGPVWRFQQQADLTVPDTRTDDPTRDWRRLREALASVRREVQRIRIRTAREFGENEAAIFDAHLLFLDDSDLLGEVRARIDSGQSVAPAWAAGVSRVEAEFVALADPYFRARAADVRAVGDQVLRVLLGAASHTSTGRGVLVARDLSPAEVAELDVAAVQAIVLAQGSPTAHSVILARARGIPVLVGAGPAVLSILDGTLVAVDGATGELVVSPGPDVLARFRARAHDLSAARQAAFAQAGTPAVTSDGREIIVAANLASLEDATAALASGADLAGLVRTEFLFLGRAQAPDVDEQVKAYLALADAVGGRRLTLRTLDVGGDKPLDYVPMPPEANPFLGLRGLRLSLARPKLFVDQLLAVVRTAHETPVSLMFPMVSTVAELKEAREYLDVAVTAEGRGVPAGLQVGIMIEVPAAALKTAAFSPYVDFFSIGTNDLTQYALAAERGNDAVAVIGDAYDPGVLRLIDVVCRDAGDALVAVCGELAADPAAAGILVGLGVRELSVAPSAVPEVKQAVRGIDAGLLAATAVTVLQAESAESVRSILARLADA